MNAVDYSAGFAGPVHLFSGLVAPDLLPALAAEAVAGPARRVTVKGSSEAWEERGVGRDAGLWRVMAAPAVTGLAETLIGAPIAHAQAWSNRYAPGERIALHTDCAGDIQLLLLLGAERAPDVALKLVGGAAARQPPMSPGDAILFSAAKIPHETLRCGGPAPRVTACMRFFAAA